jgi:signal transduction histidine kinase
VETRFEINAAFAARGMVGEQIIQIMLEGMRNAWRHGKASLATIRVSEADNLIRIAIDDDGVGFANTDAAPWSIASRVAEYGGQLSIDAVDRTGAHLKIELPSS